MVSEKSTANKAWFTQTQIHKDGRYFTSFHTRAKRHFEVSCLINCSDLDSTAEKTEIVWTIN